MKLTRMHLINSKAKSTEEGILQHPMGRISRIGIKSKREGTLTILMQQMRIQDTRIISKLMLADGKIVFMNRKHNRPSKTMSDNSQISRIIAVTSNTVSSSKTEILIMIINSFNNNSIRDNKDNNNNNTKVLLISLQNTNKKLNHSTNTGNLPKLLKDHL